MKRNLCFLIMIFSFLVTVGQKIELNSPIVATAGNKNIVDKNVSPITIAKWRIGEIYAVTLPNSEGMLIKENYLKVFPNPFTNYVNLELQNGLSGNYTLLITDLTGRQQFYNSEKSIKAGLTIQLDLSFLTSAMYILTFIHQETESKWMAKIQKH